MRLIAALLIFSSPFFCFGETSSDYIKKHAIEFKKNNIVPAVISETEKLKIVLFGESHGTNEMPDYLFKYIESMTVKRDLALGLEFPIDIQDKVDLFLKTGEEEILSSLKFFQDSDYHSGRGSDAMIRLLKDLRTLPKVKVFCFDVPISDATAPDRDTQMAKNVLGYLKKNPNHLIVTFSGNLHSRLTSGAPWDVSNKNMGSEILRLSEGSLTLNNTRNFLFRSDGGTAWQCQHDKDKNIICKDYEFGPDATVYATAVPFKYYYLQEPEMTDGHFNSIFIRRVSASMPWKGGTK